LPPIFRKKCAENITTTTTLITATTIVITEIIIIIGFALNYYFLAQKNKTKQKTNLQLEK
jgi:hypothetical protein